jgi:hypothetical protein
VIWKLIEDKAQRTGAMMHLATPELDMGPPVAYFTFSIRGESFDSYWLELKESPPESIERQKAKESLFKLIRKHGLAREFPLIISTAKAFSQRKIRITDNKEVVDAKGRPINGYDLTKEIDDQVKEKLSL